MRLRGCPRDQDSNAICRELDGYLQETRKAERRRSPLARGLFGKTYNLKCLITGEGQSTTVKRHGKIGALSQVVMHIGAVFDRYQDRVQQFATQIYIWQLEPLPLLCPPQLRSRASSPIARRRVLGHLRGLA